MPWMAGHMPREWWKAAHAPRVQMSQAKQHGFYGRRKPMPGLLAAHLRIVAQSSANASKLDEEGREPWRRGIGVEPVQWEWENSIAFESLLVCRKLVRKGEKSEERGNEHEGQIIEST